MSTPSSFLRKLAIGASLAVMVFVTSGYGVLAQPKPAEAVSWTAAQQHIEQAALAIYKSIILPFFRQMFLSWAAGESDFPLFAVSIPQFVDYVVGSSIDSFFYTLWGLRLCNGIQANIRLAVALLFFTGSFRFEFNFKGCHLTDIIDKSSFEFNWDVQVGLFERAGSDIGYYFLTGDEARANIGKDVGGVLRDIDNNGGALSMQDCSGDLNGNGRSGEKPQDCRVTTPGGIIEDFVSNNIISAQEASKTSPYLADAIALGAESFAVYLNTFLLNGLGDVLGQKSVSGAEKYDF